MKSITRIRKAMLMAVLSLLAVAGLFGKAKVQAATSCVKIAGTTLDATNSEISIGEAKFTYDQDKNRLTIGGNLAEADIDVEKLIDLESIDGLTVYFEKNTNITTDLDWFVYMENCKSVTISSGGNVKILQSKAGNTPINMFDLICSDLTFKNADMEFVTLRTGGMGADSYSIGINFAFSKVTFDNARVSFKSGGSRHNLTVSAYDDESVIDTSPKLYEKSNVEFKGCSLANGCTWKFNSKAGDIYGTGSEPVSECIIEPPSVDVSFHMNGVGAEIPDAQRITLGKTATEPKVENMTSYEFDGWYAEEKCLNRFDFTRPITKDTVIYAGWLVEVVFEPNGVIPQKWPKNQKIRRNAKAAKPETPLADGYAFEGWYQDPECDYSFGFNEGITKKTIVYAKWSAHTTHSLVKVSKKDATEVKEGVKEHYECSVCHKLFQDKDGKLQITEKDLVIAKVAKRIPKPKKVSLSLVKNNKKKTMLIKWKKVKDAKGYEVCYSNRKNFKKGVKAKKTTKVSLTIKKLKKGTTYYVRVRAYKKDAKGNNLYGDWSKTMKVKIKK
ncbi:MAG: InlB B-repeat-containing protein [Lachnospiraceae bacterium]|nr:InlB B-repeat-containing protein [Lachnospiraceae bacterium]